MFVCKVTACSFTCSAFVKQCLLEDRLKIDRLAVVFFENHFLPKTVSQSRVFPSIRDVCGKTVCWDTLTTRTRFGCRRSVPSWVLPQIGTHVLGRIALNIIA